MNTIIAIFVVVIFFIPALVISLISAVILNVVIAYTGTDYFDCWLIEREYCYEEGYREGIKDDSNPTFSWLAIISYLWHRSTTCIKAS